MRIASAADFDAALATGPYAFPGGYPHYFITADACALSFNAATDNADLIRQSIADECRDSWQVVAMDVNWEDAALFCDHTGKRIESAYAEDDAEGGA